MKKLYKFVTAISLFYFSLIGFITFPLFILEESCQVAMFATWAAKSAKAWDEMEKATDGLEKTNLTLKWLNFHFGWVNPFGWIAYHAYAVNTETYISANRRLIAKKNGDKPWTNKISP